MYHINTPTAQPDTPTDKLTENLLTLLEKIGTLITTAGANEETALAVPGLLEFVENSVHKLLDYQICSLKDLPEEIGKKLLQDPRVRSRFIELGRASELPPTMQA